MTQEAYVGITGIMSLDQAEQVKAVWGSHLTHKLMIGVLAGSKTLNGHQNKYPMRYPEIKKIAQIFPSGRETLNLLHVTTDTDGLGLYGELLVYTELCGPNLHGFQLNTFEPHLPSLQRYRVRHPEMRVVLQVGPRVMAEILMAGSPDRAAREFAAKYVDVVDGLLLDTSGGRGVEFSEYDMSLALEGLYESYGPRLMIGVAGGLCANRVSTLGSLLKIHPHLSWDAEGRLRDAADHLDMSEAKAYLRASQALLGN